MIGPEFIANGWLQPLPATLADTDMVTSTVSLGRASTGTLYAMPIVGNVEMFAYRKDLLASRGLQPPRNWDVVLKIAQTIGTADKDVSAVVFRGVKGNPIVTGFLPILWAYGGEVIDTNGKVTIDSPEALAALKMLLALKKGAPKDVDVYGAGEVRAFPARLDLLFLMLVLALKLMPPITVAVPLFSLAKWLHLLDSLLGLILAYQLYALPMAIWMLLPFVRDVPIEFEEAAALDGANLA